jgi:hypothetical protein
MTRRRRNWNPTPSWPEVSQSERRTIKVANHTVQKNSQSLCIIKQQIIFFNKTAYNNIVLETVQKAANDIV